jgi:hypothetical protein
MINTVDAGESDCKQLQTPGHTILVTYSAREGKVAEFLSFSPLTHTEADGGSV